MNANLVSLIFTGMAAVFMAVIWRDSESGRYRIALMWIAAAAIAFLIPYKSAAFFLLAVALGALAPVNPTARIGFYFASFMALPFYYDFDIPFPGINYLINIDYSKVATLVLLGPLFVAKILKPPPATLRIVDRLLLLFVLISGVMALRDLPVTSAIRATVDRFILVYIPYVAISRNLATRKDVESVLRAFFAGLVVLAAIAVISMTRGWNYYASLGEIGHKIYSDQRGGFLRIYATLTPPLLALSMGAGVVGALYLRSKAVLRGYLVFALIPLFLFVMYVTGSRGGMLGAAVTIAFYILLPRIGSAGRAALAALSFVFIAGLFFYLTQEDVQVYDPYGTFQYRAELFRTSIEQIAQRPLFGSANFLELESFQALRQGEGIIDLVNSYLQVALYFGLVGLFLFVGAHFMPLSKVYGSINVFDRGGSKQMEAIRLHVLMASLHAGYLVLIFTTSGISWIWNYGYAFIALQVALARATAGYAANQPQPAEQEPPEPAERESAVATESAQPAKPYGMRFVRRI